MIQNTNTHREAPEMKTVLPLKKPVFGIIIEKREDEWKRWVQRNYR